MNLGHKRVPLCWVRKVGLRDRKGKRDINLKSRRQVVRVR